MLNFSVNYRGRSSAGELENCSTLCALSVLSKKKLISITFYLADKAYRNFLCIGMNAKRLGMSIG